MADFAELEKVIGYEFRQKGLLRQALTHSSFANEKHMKKLSDNERLEFLGDAVLEVVSSEFLYRNYPKLPEGDLTKLRASIVCEPTLALCTREMDLGRYLFLGKGENQTGGRTRKSILSDALEAVIGAIYLDGGFAPAQRFIQKFILTDIEHKKLFYDSKTILQEVVQEISTSRFPMSCSRRRDLTTTRVSGWRQRLAGGSSAREAGIRRRLRSRRLPIRHCCN